MDYTSPVSKLLACGDGRETQRWPDYQALGIGPQHVDELIRLACDEELMDQADGTEAFGPMHAWRALADLKAESAVEPLVGLLRRIDDSDDDDISVMLPALLGRIGQTAIEPLMEYLAVPSNGLWARIAAADALGEVGQRHSDLRKACVEILAEQLRQFPRQDSSLNGGIIMALVELKAVESAEVIERAFEAGCVDEFAVGSWDDVKARLEGKEPAFIRGPSLGSIGLPPIPRRSTKDKKKAKNRKKQERKSRKRNR